MPKRVAIETKINHERWLVSYADFITLLFAFFVVMYSVSQVNENKYRVLSETLQSVFSAEGASIVADTPAVTDADPVQEPLLELDQLHAQLSDDLLAGGMARQVSVSGDGESITIELDANVLFSSGSATLHPDAADMIFALTERLAAYDNAITVAGHTDSIPISTERFADNWALSSARAVAVVNRLATLGIAPERLSAVGYGEFRPLADNTTEAGRARNRRVMVQVSRSAASVPDDLAVVLDEKDAVLLLNEQEETKTPAQIQSREISPEVQPVRLRGGGLLFTSDPQLPRVDPPRELDDQATQQQDGSPSP